MKPSPNPLVIAAMQRMLLQIQIEVLTHSILKVRAEAIGQTPAAKEYAELFSKVCEQHLLKIGDTNPVLSEMLSSEVEKMKRQLERLS